MNNARTTTEIVNIPIPVVEDAAVNEDTWTSNLGRLELETIDNTMDMRALEADWRELFDACPDCSYFQSFDYLSAAWKCVANSRGRLLRIIVGRQSGRVVIIWPLITFSKRQARWLGSEKTEYRDVLVLPGPDADKWVQETWNFIRSKLGLNWIFLQDIKSGSTIHRVLTKYAPRSQIISQTSRFIDCGAWKNWDDYFENRRRKLRADQRRQLRRLEELGTVTFRIVEKEAEIEPTISWMINRKVEWFNRVGLNETSFGSPENRKFFVAAAKHAHQSKNLFLAKLCIDDETISVLYAIVFRSTMTFICFSYDFKYENYSPSRLAMTQMLEWAFDKKLSLIDFMPGTPEYKYDWTNDEFEVFDWFVPCSAPGRLIILWLNSSTRHHLVDFHAKLGTKILSSIVPRLIRETVRRILLIS